MTPAEVKLKSSAEIIQLIGGLSTDKKAAEWLSSIIADPVKSAGVAELSRRYQQSIRPTAANANTVYIDGQKFKHLLWNNRVLLSDIGPRVGKSSGLGSMIAYRGRISYYTADDIATELGIHIDEFIELVGTEDEKRRRSA